MQLLCKKFNSEVKESTSREYGKAFLEIKKNVKIFKGIKKSLKFKDAATQALEAAKVLNKKGISAEVINIKRFTVFSFTQK